MMFVFVLLYNPGTENEGIHTLTVGDHSTILLFESGVGANYYASLLEIYGFPKPTVELTDEEEIKQFCRKSGYSFQVIPAEHVAIPPQKHKKVDSWNNSQDTSPIELPSYRLNSRQKEYYLISLKETYFIYKRNIVDLQRERAMRGFSVEINRQIEYYTEEVQKVEIELQKWGTGQPQPVQALPVSPSTNLPVPSSERLITEYISKHGHLVHKLRAKDSTGRWAYYFVLIESGMEKAFTQALESTNRINLEKYGKVIASCYGQEPNKQVKAMLKEKYGFIV
jgi:Protein of unknown function (DUF3110)